MIKVEEKGEIMLSGTTQIGDITLKPGHYLQASVLRVKRH